MIKITQGTSSAVNDPNGAGSTGGKEPKSW